MRNSGKTKKVNIRFALFIFLVIFLFALYMTISVIDAIIVNDHINVVVKDISFTRLNYNVTFIYNENGIVRNHSNVGLISPLFIKVGEQQALRGRFNIYIKQVICETFVFWSFITIICSIFIYFIFKNEYHNNKTKAVEELFPPIQ